MTILGIKNRTENWETARHFYPFFRQEASIHLARRLGEPPETDPGNVHLELYWKGMRDYLHKNRIKRESKDRCFADRYSRLFPDLRSMIERFEGFRDLKECNYNTCVEDWEVKLRNNLVNTEIDIVLQTPTRLFIGEAKYEMGFGADGALFLVHQLIRQFVMAKILLSILDCKKDVVPFIVHDDAKSLHGSHQIQFMISQDWLTKDNVLSWNEVKDLG